MKKLLLHCGLHKTGSTSIQKALALNAALLAKNSIAYPIIQTTTQSGYTGPDDNHSRLIRMNFSGRFSKEIRNFENGKLATYLQQSKCHTLIISAEEISRLKRVEMEDCRKFFEEQGYDIHAVLFVRKVRDWVDSIVGQRIAGPRGPHATQDNVFAEFEKNKGFVKPLVENMVASFPEVKLFSFDSLIEKPGGIVGGFLAWAGIDNLNLKFDLQSRNQRIPDALVRFSNFVYKKTEKDGAHLKENFLAEYDIFSKFKSRKFHLSENEIQAYLPMLRAENNWLSDTYSDQFFDSQIDAVYGSAGDVEFRNFINSCSSELSLTTRNLLTEYFCRIV
jgi:hypothetical protein